MAVNNAPARYFYPSLIFAGKERSTRAKSLKGLPLWVGIQPCPKMLD